MGASGRSFRARLAQNDEDSRFSTVVQLVEHDLLAKRFETSRTIAGVFCSCSSAGSLRQHLGEEKSTTSGEWAITTAGWSLGPASHRACRSLLAADGAMSAPNTPR
jgi:hypothetical protein